MNTLHSIVTAFYAAAALIGLVSISGALLCGIFAVVRWRTASSLEYMSVENPDVILMVLTGMTRFMQFLARGAGALGKWVARILAIASAAGLMVALFLFLTARGLENEQPWARLAAEILTSVMLLASLFAMVATRGLIRVVSLLLVAGSGRVLWQLCHGFLT